MAKALRVEVGIDGLAETLKGLNGLAAAAKGVPTSLQFRAPSSAAVARLGEYARQLALVAFAANRLSQLQKTSLPALPSGSQNPQGSPEPAAAPRPAGRRTGGAEARLERAQAALADLQRLPYVPTYRLRDAQADVARAQAAVSRQNNLLTPPAPQAPQGAQARLAAAQAHLQALRAQPNAPVVALQDAQGAVARAQRAVAAQNKLLNPAQPPTWLNRLATLIGSTRVNLPGGGGFSASPLLNKTFDLLGMVGPKATLLAGGLGAAASAAGLFVTGMKAASERLASFADASRLSGGTAAQVGALSALGLEPGQIADAAKAFREQTSVGSGDMFGPLGRQRLGLPAALPRQFGGNLNEAAELLQAIRELRKIGQTQGLDAQLELVRQVPSLEGFLGVARATDAEWKRLEEDMASFQRQIDSGALEKGAEAQREFNRASRELQNTLAADLAPMLKGTSTGLAVLTDLIKDVGSALKVTGDVVGWFLKLPEDLGKGLESVSKRFNVGWMGQLTSGLLRLVMLPFNMLSELGKQVNWLWNLAHGQSPAQAAQNAQAAAVNKNTAAVNNLTVALQEGLFGGGARAQGALPSGLIPYLQGASAGNMSEFDRVINGRTLALGAWSL